MISSNKEQSLIKSTVRAKRKFELVADTCFLNCCYIAAIADILEAKFNWVI